jgi:hypothetical protein
MAIDLNDEIRVWGGFTQKELSWAGGVLAALFFVFFLGLTKVTGRLLVGLLSFLSLAGPWVAFVMYQRDLPKGYLLRRFRQEGKFLFLRVGVVKGIDLYAPPCVDRAQAWAEAMGEEDVRGS